MKRLWHGIGLRRTLAMLAGLALATLIAPTAALAVNAYITNLDSNTVSVIDIATNTVTATIPVGSFPVAFGVFIQPPQLAWTSGFSNCHGQSISALAQQFGGLGAAAAALGLPSVKALQDAIKTFCHG